MVSNVDGEPQVIVLPPLALYTGAIVALVRGMVLAGRLGLPLDKFAVSLSFSFQGLQGWQCCGTTPFIRRSAGRLEFIACVKAASPLLEQAKRHGGLNIAAPKVTISCLVAGSNMDALTVSQLKIIS